MLLVEIFRNVSVDACICEQIYSEAETDIRNDFCQFKFIFINIFLKMFSIKILAALTARIKTNHIT